MTESMTDLYLLCCLVIFGLPIIAVLASLYAYWCFRMFDAQAAEDAQAHGLRDSRCRPGLRGAAAAARRRQ
jgi:hypothetical protein